MPLLPLYLSIGTLTAYLLRDTHVPCRLARRYVLDAVLWPLVLMYFGWMIVREE